MGIDRVKSRVEQGGHNIPEKVIRRRFERSQKNVETLFKPIVDIWVVFDTSSSIPILINNSTMNKSDYYAEIGMKAAKRAAKKTIENANREKRPIPIWEKGRIKHEIPSFSTCT